MGSRLVGVGSLLTLGSLLVGVGSLLIVAPLRVGVGSRLVGVPSLGARVGPSRRLGGVACRSSLRGGVASRVRLRSRRVAAHGSFLRTSFDALPPELQKKHGQNGNSMGWS